MLWVGCPCRGLLFRVRSDPCQSRYTLGSRSPSASSSSVKPMVFSHPLSLPIIVANSRLEDYSFEGRQDLNPHFLFTAPSLSVTVLIYIYIIPQVFKFVKRVFLFFFKISLYRLSWSACPRKYLGYLSLLTFIIIAQVIPKVNTFLKVIFLTMPGRLVLTNSQIQKTD